MAAEDVVGSLAVKLALQSGSFDAGMKRVGTELKSIDSGFKASAAEAAAAGQKFDTLGQKQIALSQKLEVQQAATVAYRQQLDQLKAKMTNLGTAQTDLKEKVSSAKTAYEQAKNELKEHRKVGDLTEEELKQLSQRVEELGDDYKKLTQQEKQTASNMTTLQGTISKTENAYNTMRAQTANTRQELARIEKEIKTQSSAWGKLEAAAEKAQKPLENAGKSLNNVGNKLTVGLTVPITAALYKASDAAMDFEDQLAKIGTMPGVTTANLKAIGSNLLQISNDTNTAITDMTAAEYQALSSGVAVAQSANYMNVSARAAKGGFADLTTAVNGSTSVLNAWQLDASAATDVYNKMIVAQNFGKTTLGEIASNIGNVAATAAGLKVSYTEVLAATAALTKGGITTSQAMTMLNQVLASVLKPTADAKKQAKALGLEFDAAALKSKGLAGFLKDIEAKAGGNETAIAKLFGSVEAYKAVAALAGAQSADFAEALEAMESSAGAVDSAFETVSNTTGNKARTALNKLKNEAIEFGDVMLPTISDLMDKASGVIDVLAEMDDATRNNLLLGAGAAALVGPSIKAFGGLATGASSVAKLIGNIKKAGGIAGSLGLVGLPLAAGAAAIGVAALTSKIIMMNSESAKVDKRVASVSLEMDEQSKADFAAKVSDISVNTQKALEIKTTVNTEKTDLATQFETAISNGKFTKGEENKLRKAIDGWVDDAITGVKTDTATKAADMAAALDSIAGLSDESKTKIVAAVEANGDQQIAELQGYQDELNALLASMKGGTEAITADKIARYNELLALIGNMKTEIEEANAGLTEYYQALKNYVESGNASPEAAQTYTQMGLQQAKTEYNQGKTERQSTISDNQTALNMLEKANAKDWKTSKFMRENDVVDGGVVTLQQNIQTEFANGEQAEQDYQQKLVDIINKGTDAALAGVQNGDNRLSGLLDNYMTLGFLDSDPNEIVSKLGNDSDFRQKYADAINSVLGSAYSADEMDTSNANGLSTWITASEEAINKLKTGIADELDTGDFNPVAEMLKNSMDGVDLSEIDTSKLSENVKGLFALLDFDTTNGEVTKNIWQGMANGLTENYNIAETAMSNSSQSLIQKIKDDWGIKSPSTVMKAIYKNVVLGAEAGITENVGLLKTPFQTLVDTDFPQLGKDMMDALVTAINGKAESLKTAMENSVKNAISAAQLKANKGIKIPVSLLYSSPSTRSLSQDLGL
ncbi:MAG: phage tail tape measure protein [Eubacteriales bacterium]|nr:phage tail tape measure protein [Eubacteriales bacterium]